jgi:hypothetical protein
MLHRTDSATTDFDFFMYRASSKRVRDIVTIPCRFAVRTLAWPLKKTWEHVLFNCLKQINSTEVNRNICPLLVITITNTLATSLVAKLWCLMLTNWHVPEPDSSTSRPNQVVCSVRGIVNNGTKNKYLYDVIHYMYVQFRVLARSFITQILCELMLVVI